MNNFQYSMIRKNSKRSDSLIHSFPNIIIGLQIIAGLVVLIIKIGMLTAGFG